MTVVVVRPCVHFVHFRQGKQFFGHYWRDVYYKKCLWCPLWCCLWRQLNTSYASGLCNAMGVCLLNVCLRPISHLFQKIWHTSENCFRGCPWERNVLDISERKQMETFASCDSDISQMSNYTQKLSPKVFTILMKIRCQYLVSIAMFGKVIVLFYQVSGLSYP